MEVHRGRILCKDMHRESDGPQNLQFHYFHIEDIVRDLFADPMAKRKQHLYFRRDIGPDGKRRFTDAHPCLAFEHAAREIGEGVVHFSLVLYVDGTSQWRNVSVCPVYLTTRNNDKSIQNRPSSQRLLAVLPIYDIEASKLSPADKTYRRKEVYYTVFYTLLHAITRLLHVLELWLR